MLILIWFCVAVPQSRATVSGPTQLFQISCLGYLVCAANILAVHHLFNYSFPSWLPHMFNQCIGCADHGYLCCMCLHEDQHQHPFAASNAVLSLLQLSQLWCPPWPTEQCDALLSHSPAVRHMTWCIPGPTSQMHMHLESHVGLPEAFLPHVDSLSFSCAGGPSSLPGGCTAPALHPPHFTMSRMCCSVASVVQNCSYASLPASGVSVAWHQSCASSPA